MHRLTLAEAIKTNQLERFVQQEEARGVGPIDRAEFDTLLKKAATTPQSEDQTSRSASVGGSSGKRTRRGSGPYTSR